MSIFLLKCCQIFAKVIHSVHSSIQFTAPLFYTSIQFTAPLFYSSIQFNAVKFLHSNVSNFCPISSSQHHTFSSQHHTCTQTRSSHTHNIFFAIPTSSSNRCF